MEHKQINEVLAILPPRIKARNGLSLCPLQVHIREKCWFGEIVPQYHKAIWYICGYYISYVLSTLFHFL